MIFPGKPLEITETTKMTTNELWIESYEAEIKINGTTVYYMIARATEPEKMQFKAEKGSVNLELIPYRKTYIFSPSMKNPQS